MQGGDRGGGLSRIESRKSAYSCIALTRSELL